MKYISLIIVLLVLNSCKPKADFDTPDLTDKISTQLKFSPVLNPDFDITQKKVFPRSLNPDGDLELVTKKDWTSGFYPGVLWYTYALTKDEYWKTKAITFTNVLESEKKNASNHDIGFKMMPSFGLGYEQTNNSAYKNVLIQSAKTLITRFDEKVGCIRSWDHHKDKWQFPVIIDNLMNLELLYWAWKETGDPVYYNIATTHAKTTMKNHFRKDYSSYHVVNYDTITGKVISKQTHQGYADNSSWARGESWALYGYTMAYRESNDSEFLKQAEHVANYIINVATLPEDYVPTWDFMLSDKENEPKDASAAAVIASALYELSTFTENTKNKNTYLKVANGIMKSLSSKNYFNVKGTEKGFLLNHSTGSKPWKSEIDVPLVYADYYYLEALTRKANIQIQPN
ncbi:glycoside hydrolase family protein [Formosa algae]|uniref:glycoside hydrolase family 88 protein n=1 Tax=Formosa algae TaxID=225843 RepID=UPI000CCEAF6B|nr:glycoside hydrolase family 88 protein [Formosa algae]PNW26469.1 glucuronyl hydrolase [Formosa algae]